MTIRYLLFDLDETLYPRNTETMRQIGGRICRYICDTLGHTPEEAGLLARHYYERYGTATRGLVLHHNVDPEHFLTFIHDLPLDDILPNRQLDRLLESLPLEKVIFTNASQAHARRVLARLEVGRHFSRIIDLVAVDYVSKPLAQAYANCLRLLAAGPEQCVLIEDSARNLAPAAELGMTTVLVDGDDLARADYHIANILDLDAVIADICRRQDCPAP